MSASLLIREPLGERRAATPLRFGGTGADVVIPGADDAGLRLDFAGGQFWVRPADGGRVLVNGVAHVEPLALLDGDVLQLGQAQLVYASATPSLDVVHLAIERSHPTRRRQIGVFTVA